MATATKKDSKAASKGATFISGDNNLRLVRVPRRRRLNADTGEYDTSDGSTVEFREGRYTTDDSELLSFLRDHDQNGVLFVEEGKEPDRPLPETGDLLEAVVQAVADADGDKLAAIYLQERNTHSRPEVLKAARTGMEAIDADVPDPDPEPAYNKERIRDEGGAPLAGGEAGTK